MKITEFENLVDAAQTSEGVRSVMETHWHDVIGTADELQAAWYHAETRAATAPSWNIPMPVTLMPHWETNTVDFLLPVRPAA